MRTRSLAAVAALAFAAAGSGCAQLENLGTILGQPAGAGGSATLVAEVQSVNTSNQEIVLRTQEGQTGAVRYDSRTRVVYQDREYPVTALERGDVVEMRVVESGNAYYTDEILVRQSVQERTGTGTGGDAALRVLDGTVGQVDYDRGAFELRTRDGVVVVTLPYGTRAADADYFRRLRTGDHVSVRGRYVTSTRFELERFQ